jgi:hypothetical protein
LVRAVNHAAIQQFAFARPTGTVFAAVRKAYALAYRGQQNGLVTFYGELTATGGEGDGEGHG